MRKIISIILVWNVVGLVISIIQTFRTNDIGYVIGIFLFILTVGYMLGELLDKMNEHNS